MTEKEAVNLYVILEEFVTKHDYDTGSTTNRGFLTILMQSELELM
jgi:hypothetical protein